MPERIQLSRKRGWRMPPNTVKVTRPGKWGNPYKVGAIDEPTGKAITPDVAVHLYRGMASQTAWPEFRENMRKELAGKNLACWCKLGEPCHADVLLEIANTANDSEYYERRYNALNREAK